MVPPTRVETFLTSRGIEFVPLPLMPAKSLDAAILGSGVPREEAIQATLLIGFSGVMMAVHAYGAALDMEAINQLAGKHLKMLTAQQADRLFSECVSGFYPPIGAAYEIPVLVDERVLEMPRAVMTSGSAGSLLAMDRTALRSALTGARTGPITIIGPDHERQDRSAVTLEEVASRLQALYRLPPMPALALRILRLTSNPKATVRELSDMIEFDPSLTAQIMRYARSALFNYPGQIDNVQDAVTRVLGFDRVAHIALGIASVRAFDVPRKGLLGMDEFWRHSLYCAFLTQQIAPMCEADKGLAYLCGLLHNFGLLLIGHLFPDEFSQLNALRESNPEHTMQALEQQVFGADNGQALLAVGHGAIGGILHKLWQLPDAVVKAAGVHQQPDYHGEHEVYVLMVQLANELLKEKAIGDEFNPPDYAVLRERLGLTEADLETLREAVETVSEDLDALARSLSA